MRKIFLTILLGISLSLHAQNTTIAKINFEAAEEAYNNSNYELALEKLQKAEENFGQINVPILYLRIVNQDKFLAQKPSFALLKDLRNNCKDFLSKYSNDVDAFEKIKEVYNIDEKWSNYKTEADFEDFTSSMEIIKLMNEITDDYKNAFIASKSDLGTGTLRVAMDYKNQLVVIEKVHQNVAYFRAHLTEIEEVQFKKSNIIFVHKNKTDLFGKKEFITTVLGHAIKDKLLKLINLIETAEKKK